jgi:phosphatidylinositol alpha-mannosyltransferase
VAVSIPARDFVSRYFDGDYNIVPNGIDTSNFRPDLEPMPGIRTEGQSTVLFVGRMEQRKGFPVLLRAYALLRQQRSDVRLVAVGDGPMRWGYERQVEAEGIPDVMFTGQVGSDVLPRYYASADVFGSPAIGGESFGIVLLEAMACGVPVLASAIPGFSQVVTSGQDGLLAPPRQPDVWAQALETLLNEPELRRSMGQRGVQKAQRYDWNRVTDSILGIYDEARLRAAAQPVPATAI